MPLGGSDASESITLEVSDQSQLASLREHLRRIPGTDVTQVPGKSGSGELGAWDVLQVAAAGSGVLAVAIKTLPEFIRSRRSDITITITSGEKSITLTVTNAEDGDKWFGGDA